MAERTDDKLDYERFTAAELDHLADRAIYFSEYLARDNWVIECEQFAVSAHALSKTIRRSKVPDVEPITRAADDPMP